MAEMHACEGLRTRQDTLADILERLALGLSDTDDVAELAHHIEGAIEHGRTQRVDGEIDPAAIREVQYRFLEVFVFRDYDALGAILQRQLLFARRAGPCRSPARRPSPRALSVNKPTPPPMALTRTISPRLRP